MPSKNIAFAGASLCTLLIPIYLLRAVRDEMAVQTGTQSLGWLISFSFLALILLSLLFSISGKTNRLIYRGFIASLCLLYPAMALIPAFPQSSTAPILFVLIGSSNLLLVSQFWLGLKEFFTETTAKKAYPQIMLIGSFGVLGGPLIVTAMAGQTITLFLIVSSIFLALSALFIANARVITVPSLSRLPPQQSPKKSRQWPMAGLILIYSTLATVLYGEHIATVEEFGLNQTDRIQFFGRRDLWIGLITLILQWLGQKVKSQENRWVGFRLMPVLTLAVLLLIGWQSSLETVLWSMVIFRSFNYAYARPARELYFINTQGRFNFKNFIDTVIYRAGDLLGIWLFQLLTGWQFDYLQIACLLAPLIAFWIILNKRIVKTLNA
ncbi:MAG: hypothetical protein HEP71_02815 [Roseivirga sp.]|nr:hypothetical protein [Roseivirga sp.]